MNILVLSFYYPPDLCAGSFRTHALVTALANQLPADSVINVITTMPNRYESFKAQCLGYEEQGNIRVHRVTVPEHKSGFADQARTFVAFYRQALSIAKKLTDVDLVFATSSRLMTAYLGRKIAKKLDKPLYLDIRDIFVDTMDDVLAQSSLKLLLPMFHQLEKMTMQHAITINLVSPGFNRYFKVRYPSIRYQNFTNGIDDEFINYFDQNQLEHEKSAKIKVVYAGNIGAGQGLETILPGMAKQLAESHEFYVVGDGGKKTALITELNKECVTSVTLTKPVQRNALKKIYAEADILFLHLNDFPAFEKVLPSKLFEYGASGKPIVAGVGGYAAQFITTTLSGAKVFAPCNVAAGVEALRGIDLTMQGREQFVQQYNRQNIMADFAQDIIDFAKGQA